MFNVIRVVVFFCADRDVERPLEGLKLTILQKNDWHAWCFYLCDKSMNCSEYCLNDWPGRSDRID